MQTIEGNDEARLYELMNSAIQQRPDSQTQQRRVSHQTLQHKKGRKKKQAPVEEVREQLESEILDFEDEFVPPLPPPLFFPFTSETSGASVRETARNPISSSSSTVSSEHTSNPISASTVSSYRANPISTSTVSSHRANPISTSTVSSHKANSISTSTVSSHRANPISTSTVSSHRANPISTSTDSSHRANPISTSTVSSHRANPISTSTVSSHRANPISTSTVGSQTGSISPASTFTRTAGRQYSAGAWKYFEHYPPYLLAYAPYPPSQPVCGAIPPQSPDPQLVILLFPICMNKFNNWIVG